MFVTPCHDAPWDLMYACMSGCMYVKFHHTTKKDKKRIIKQEKKSNNKS